jgi:ubiquitin carboxyl-terminal hydrolase 22/27/51
MFNTTGAIAIRVNFNLALSFSLREKKLWFGKTKKKKKNVCATACPLTRRYIVLHTQGHTPNQVETSQAQAFTLTAGLLLLESEKKMNHVEMPMLKVEPCCVSPNRRVPARCDHLRAFKREGGIDAFRVVQWYLRACKLSIMQLPCILCFDCGRVDGGRLHVCLQCVYVACKEPLKLGKELEERQSHLEAHMRKSGHVLALDVDHDRVFCRVCNDYVYDEEIQSVLVSERNVHVALREQIENPNPKRARFSEWRPPAAERALIMANAKRVGLPPHLLGLRGLSNLGNTCFMSCILQSFLHNPLLRNYFLSDLHNRAVCRAERAASPSTSRPICLACEMDELFGEMYCGVRAPLIPHKFLHSVWKFSNSFAGYEQQDAHEFLITALDGLHSHCGGGGGAEANCSCIIHRIFFGVMQSDVICQTCNTTSTQWDPFFDISLELPRDPSPPPRTATSRASSSSSSSSSTLAVADAKDEHDSGGADDSDIVAVDDDNDESKRETLNVDVDDDDNHVDVDGIDDLDEASNASSSSSSSSPSSLSAPLSCSAPSPALPLPPPAVTLFDCLRRFTRPESLETAIDCDQCKSCQPCEKQLSLHMLPQVLCIHLKRFKQSIVNRKYSHKINTFVEFPEQLDLANYLSPAIIEERGGTAFAPAFSLNEHYELFAVVNHQGRIDNGHYVCYVRHSGLWMKCDDSWITEASLCEVLASNAYLLFYVRKHLEYC